jgi:hypothetical protein
MDGSFGNFCMDAMFAISDPKVANRFILVGFRENNEWLVASAEQKGYLLVRCNFALQK